MKRTRLDALVVQQGLAADAKHAGALIMAGHVRVDGGRIRRPAEPVRQDAVLELIEAPYVSRGGYKLAGALDALGLDVAGLDVADAGASTGGFTDCLLQRGARLVHAIDVGKGLLAWRVRQDARVRVHERTHIATCTSELLGGPVDLVTADLSFISLRAVLPALLGLVHPGGRLLLLVKPQFEARREEVPDGGVVRDEALRQRVVDEVAAAAHELGATEMARVPSALPGTEGNIEFFVLLKNEGPPKNVGDRAAGKNEEYPP